MAFWQKLRGLLGASKDTPAQSPRELFLAEVEELLHAVPAVASVTRQDGEYGLDVVDTDGRRQSFFLENLFLESREQSPEDRRESIRRLISFVGRDDVELDWDSAKDRLVPLVRTSTLFPTITYEPMQRPVRRPFAPFLIEAIALDLDDSFEYVSAQTVASWGVDVDDVFEVARQCAATHFSDGDVERYDSEAEFPLWHVSLDGYETSRLALPGWLAAFHGRVVGRPVAIVPQRSVLIVGGDGDERCLRRLIDIADREYAASPRNLSPALYTVDDDGAVIPLVLPQGHAMAHDVALGHLRLALDEYEASQAPLQEEVGDDVYVASLVGVRSEDGSVSSYAVWTEDVPTMLPPATEIAFVRLADDEQAKDHFRVPWAEVHREGLLEPVPDIDPPRWRTKGWPTRAVLARLRRVASD